MKFILLPVVLMSSLANASSFTYNSKPEPAFQIPGETVIGLTNIAYDGAPILTLSPEDRAKQNSLKMALESARNAGDADKAQAISAELALANTTEKNFHFLARRWVGNELFPVVASLSIL